MHIFKKQFVRALACAALTTTSLTMAQDLEVPVLELPYQSVFQNYQMHGDVPLRDWKISNEAVRKAGGWRQYLKESQAPDALDVPVNTKPSAVDHSTHVPQKTELKKP